MYVIARQMWGQRFPGKALPPDDEEGRRETIRRVVADVGQEHGKPETLVKDAKAAVAQVKKFIKDNDILRLPDPDNCKVEEMPEFHARQFDGLPEPGPAARPEGEQLSTPSARRRSTGTSARWRATWKSTTATCCTSSPSTRRIPGHYVQLEYANRNPSLIRKVLSFGRVRRGVGGVHRADDARPGLRQRRPGAAAEPVEVLPAGGGQRDPRPQDALHAR